MEVEIPGLPVKNPKEYFFYSPGHSQQLVALCIKMAKYLRFDLDERLIDFSVGIITLSENLPATIAGKHLSGQVT